MFVLRNDNDDKDDDDDEHYLWSKWATAKAKWKRNRMRDNGSKHDKKKT